MQLPTTRDRLTIDSKKSEDESDSPELRKYKTHRRFDRATRLFGESGMTALGEARVLVIGVGGVGSFVAESLARSGVGTIVLVDFDKVCVTNTNRQLHAMQGTIGRHKVEVMAERLRLVHPTGSVETIREFYSSTTSETILSGKIDFVVDCIDNMTAKAHLVAKCLSAGIPLVSSMGAAARLDPTKVEVKDLAETHHDAFAAALRKILRSEYGLDFGGGKLLGVPAVFSPEEVILPSPPSYDDGVGFRCVCPGGKNGMHDCDRRARIDGTASFVTGTFGLVAASVVVRTLIAGHFENAPRGEI
jgi:tRNA A37 threonylcarbamoyladenosine dehydratase